MHKRAYAFALFLIVSVVAINGLAQTTFRPVVVTHPRVGGGTIICQGSACAALLDSLRPGPSSEMLQMELPALEDIPIDGAKFCNTLKASKPAGCSLSNPPPSPGISVPGKPPYEPNGCGTGKMSNLFADAFLQLVARPTYSGDFQAPYPNVSFREACAGHDTCWARGGEKNACDYTFRSDMISACGGDSVQNNVCIGFSGLYHSAVTNTGMAQNAYNESSGNRACALWAENMRANSCN